MGRINLDSILEIVNEEKEKRNLEDFVPLYPMFRVDNNNLYIGVMLSNINENIWDNNSNSICKYWCLIDINTLKIIEFNDIEEKNYYIKEKNKNANEIAEYERNKKEEYQNYLMNDILDPRLPICDKLFNSLNNKIYLDEKELNINDYLKENAESLIKIKVKELIDILMQSKYGLITLCYDNLYNKIIDIYKNDNIIDFEKLNVCIEVMNNYYYGVIGIDDFFNLDNVEDTN